MISALLLLCKFTISLTKFDGLGHHKPLQDAETFLQHSSDYPTPLMYFL